MEKLTETLILSEEILGDLELDRIPLEKICFKCLRLARLLGDSDSIKWFSLEINGYDFKNVLPSIPNGEYFNIGLTHGRGIIVEELGTDSKKQQVQKIWTSSVGSLETSTTANKVALDNISTPQSFTPAIGSFQSEGYYSNVPLKTEIVHEKYADVVTKVAKEQNTIISSIKSNQEILGRVRMMIYSYINERHYQLKYGDAVYNIFETSRVFTIDTVSRLYPELLPILSSIDDNLQSDNQIDWSNAVHNCRRILTELADRLCPPQTEKKKVGNKEIDLGPGFYINRLIHYIESKSGSEKFKKVVGTDLQYIGERLDAVYESSNKGTHTTVETKEEAERYVIHTFLLIADILKL